MEVTRIKIEEVKFALSSIRVLTKINELLTININQ